MAKLLKLRKKEVPYEEMQASVGQLAFYPENPRIYSQFAGSGDRTQENIQAKLEGMDHVKELRSQIDRDGQVNEPLFCIRVSPESELHGQYEYQVLEGNSRLAALRMNKKSSLPPPRVACNVLDFSAYSEQETESLIFTLLGGFHITGKTDWRSYENAAYIYRRFKNQEVPIEDIAKEISSLSLAKVRQMVNAFQMMIDAGDDNTSRWSYYEAYASSAKLKNHRGKHPGIGRPGCFVNQGGEVSPRIGYAGQAAGYPAQPKGPENTSRRERTRTLQGGSRGRGHQRRYRRCL